MGLHRACWRAVHFFAMVFSIAGPSRAEVLCAFSISSDSASSCYDGRGTLGLFDCDETSTGPCSRDNNDPDGFEVAATSPVLGSRLFST
jgi:hypothetical protein